MKTRGTVEAVEAVVAPSGSFSDSLTVSGIPVSTGTGGGGTANTLQDAYDNGTGAVSTDSGKPVVVLGSADPGLTVSGNQNVFGSLLLDDGAGVTNSVSVTNVNQEHDLFIHTQNDFNLGVASHNTAPAFRGYRSKGSHSSPTAMNFVDTSLALIGHGWDTANETFEPMGSILIWAPLVGHSAGSTPGEISFWTTPAGSVIQGLRMIVSDSGNIGINVGFFPTERLHVGGNILSTGEVTAVSGSFSAALTAATFAGIESENLLDRSTAQTISGVWTFDPDSNTEGIRILGTAGAGVEQADLYVGTAGQLVVTVTGGSDTGQWIEVKPQDDQFGLVIRDGSGGSANFANLYLNDAATDYLSISVNSASSTDALVVDDNDNVGIGVLPDSSVDLDVAGNARIAGDLGIGALPGAGLALDVAGDASIDGSLFVNADSLVDEVQLGVRATADQASNVFVVEDASAVDIFTVSGTDITATVGDAQIGNSVLEFYKGTELKYSWAWDNSGGSTGTFVLATGTIGDAKDVFLTDPTQIVWNNESEDMDFIVRGSSDVNLIHTDAGNDRLGVGTPVPSGKLTVTQPDFLGALPVLGLEQIDTDQSFIDFIGTTAADGSASLSTDTTEDSTKFGAIRVLINGVTKWIRVYDDES